MGDLLKTLGEWDEAEKVTKKAIQINPNFADAYYCLAGILRSSNRIDEAKEVTQKFLKLRPWSIIGSYSLNNYY